MTFIVGLAKTQTVAALKQSWQMRCLNERENYPAMHSTKAVIIKIRIKSREPSTWWRAYFFRKNAKKS